MSLKVQLRRKILAERKSLSPKIWQEKSQQLCQNLKKLPQFQDAKTILAYFSIRQEPDLSSLLRISQQQKWGFSRCVGKSLIWHFWQPGDPLEIGSYNLQQPASNLPLIDPLEVDLILIPAVACDYQGYRLGYGGGYYDRMLNQAEWKHKTTIGIVFDFAFLPQLPVDNWDQKLVGVCTEKQFYIS